MAACEDYFAGETLDLLFDLLDDDELDEHFEAQIEEETNEICSLEDFKCSSCDKVCKSKGGLARHTNAKHNEPKDIESHQEVKFVLELGELLELLQEAKQALSVDQCYPEALRNKIATFDNLEQAASLMLAEVKKLFDKLATKGDAEQFFKHYYTNIVFYLDLFFRGIEKPCSTLLAKRLGDKILYFYKKPASGPITKPMEISKRELGSLQYLSGYVVGKLLKITRNNKKYRSKENQKLIKILQEMTTEECSDQRLIHTLNRGGLKALIPNGQAMFKILEETYRIKTAVTNLHQIDTCKITSNLMKNVDINSNFNAIVESVTDSLEKELKENLLEKLISLYLRVRAFSTARDIIDKHRATKTSKKSKGLRKSIKKAADKENIEK